MRLLLVEDDASLSDVLIRALREESYAVDHAEDGQEGEWMACENPYDLIILDLMLPVKDGISVLKAIRSQGVNTPVLILTAKDAKEDLILGLDSGADDYLSKPFNLDELYARIRVLLRRRNTETNTTLRAGPLAINLARREVTCFEKSVDLTTKEYALLEYLMRNVDNVVTRTQISEHVWDVNFEANSNVVDVYMGYLRSKIDKVFGQNMIKTVRGHGYMLDTSEIVPDSHSFAKASGDNVVHH